ncbi:MAG: hypothetical protein A2Y81_07075 [Nitrospirae bacterium RBG_13_43_8]|nr:MAG: hypothetical protein A2Y81_07075 [Nitrospirae bacterium RBG_13_43_8]
MVKDAPYFIMIIRQQSFLEQTSWNPDIIVHSTTGKGQKSITMNIIKKAIVAVAGSGTRFLPATKTMPKEMLPIVDKPIIQLVVEELVEAGIEDIILVTKWDKKPLEDHFDHNWALANELKGAGKLKRLEEIKSSLSVYLMKNLLNPMNSQKRFFVGVTEKNGMLPSG